MADDTAKELSPAAQRLCSEIQLFDLCDLDSCQFRTSRFCTNEDLLARFESIKDEDEQETVLYVEEEDDEEIDSGADFDDFDDLIDEDNESS